MNHAKQHTIDKQAIDANKRRQRGKALPGRVEQTIKMKVLAAINLATCIDLGNGAKEEIVKIMLHPDKLVQREKENVHIKPLEVCKIVKIEHSTATQLAHY